MPKINNIQKEVIECQQCPRLIRWCKDVAQTKRKQFMDWDYWGKPVPSWGDPNAQLLIVGLAPAAHGANRTGRMFTGDRSGDWLYRGLYKAGFANQPNSTDSDDGLALNNCWITAGAHCAPPQNKLTAEELNNCRPWLVKELHAMPQIKVVLCLGSVALKTFWQTIGSDDDLKQRFWGEIAPKNPPLTKFGHGVVIPLERYQKHGQHIVCSYHPSQQNTFTKRLTEPMFDDVFATINQLLAK